MNGLNFYQGHNFLKVGESPKHLSSSQDRCAEWSLQVEDSFHVWLIQHLFPIPGPPGPAHPLQFAPIVTEKCFLMPRSDLPLPCSNTYHGSSLASVLVMNIPLSTKLLSSCKKRTYLPASSYRVFRLYCPAYRPPLHFPRQHLANKWPCQFTSTWASVPNVWLLTAASCPLPSFIERWLPKDSSWHIFY